MLKNNRLVRALRRQPVDRTPIWLMRQAGRYLPEYRAVRQRAGSFLTMAKTPDLACEVTLQPLKRFPLDAAILFSDILTIPDAMGLGLYFVEGQGPKFRNPIRDTQSIARLSQPDMATDLAYVMDAVRLIRHELDDAVPLIGFAGSPWTLACYMVEGESSKSFSHIKTLALREPAALHQLLTTLTEAVITYLDAQRQAGAQVLQIFDTWGGILSPSDYHRFSLPYLSRIAQSLAGPANADHTPLILFGRGNGPYIDALAQTGADAISVDWTVSIRDAAQQAAGRIALQGNLDPAVLYAPPAIIAQEARRVLDQYAQGNGGSPEGHVFNLGHGMAPDMQNDHVAALIEAVQQSSRR